MWNIKPKHKYVPFYKSLFIEHKNKQQKNIKTNEEKNE